MQDKKEWTVSHHAAFHGRHSTLRVGEESVTLPYCVVVVQLLIQEEVDVMTVDSQGNLPGIVNCLCKEERCPLFYSALGCG